MTTFLDKLRQLLHIKKREQRLARNDKGKSTAVVTAENVQRLVRLLELTDIDECSCAETFDLLDEYVDLVDTNAEAAALMPLVKQHLDKCPHCQEMFETLLLALQTEV
ncbi:MAG: hypothetical protein R6X32_08155 [Chloroflexota bacterium]|jgi:hypothetical protein